MRPGSWALRETRVSVPRPRSRPWAQTRPPGPARGTSARFRDRCGRTRTDGCPSAARERHPPGALPVTDEGAESLRRDMLAPWNVKARIRTAPRTWPSGLAGRNSGDGGRDPGRVPPARPTGVPLGSAPALTDLIFPRESSKEPVCASPPFLDGSPLPAPCWAPIGSARRTRCPSAATDALSSPSGPQAEAATP